MNKFLLIDGFTVFGLQIKFYGILMAIAFIAGFFVVKKLSKQKGFDENLPYDLILIAFPCGIVGARLNYVLFTLENNWTFLEILQIWNGGLMIYGGVIFAMIGIVVYCLIKKISIIKVFDIVAPALILGQAIGRWGNFFNQEAYGSLITNSALQWFPFGVYIDSAHFTTEASEQVVKAFGTNQSGAWFNATFFYESFWCLLGFFLLYFIAKKSNTKGLSMSTYFAYYGVERFFVEMLRTDSLYLGNIKISVLISAVICIAGITYLTYLFFHNKIWQKKTLCTENDVSNISAKNLKNNVQKLNDKKENTNCEDKTKNFKDSSLKKTSIKSVKMHKNGKNKGK